MNTNSDTEKLLTETARRLQVLSATSSSLFNMVSQLHHLRKLANDTGQEIGSGCSPGSPKAGGQDR